MKAAPHTLMIAAGVAAAICAGCASSRVAPRQPSDRTSVVLLPDPDGATGAVHVAGKTGAQDLSRPYESTQVAAGTPPSPPVTLTEADIKRDYADVLAELPPAAERFNLYFRIDSSELTEESRALLPSVLKAVSARTVPEVTVIGHTDTTGGSQSNYQLALKRAMTVRALLLKTGLDPALVEVESHGEAELLKRTPDNTPEPLNRRVEITIK
jgi:outer membrane protein OmpA-like peptidoglycan-associated protein